MHFLWLETLCCSLLLKNLTRFSIYNNFKTSWNYYKYWVLTPWRINWIFMLHEPLVHQTYVYMCKSTIWCLLIEYLQYNLQHGDLLTNSLSLHEVLQFQKDITREFIIRLIQFCRYRVEHDYLTSQLWNFVFLSLIKCSKLFMYYAYFQASFPFLLK